MLYLNLKSYYMKKIFLKSIYFLFNFLLVLKTISVLKKSLVVCLLVGAVINQEDYQILDKDPKIIKIVQGDFNALT